MYTGKPSRAAFTLLELLLVVAVIGILCTLMIPSSQPNVCEQLDATAHVIGTDLAYARSLAIGNNSYYRTTWDLANNRYILQYNGANTSLATLPKTPFSSPGDPPTQHITDLDTLPHIGPPAQLVAAASTGNSISPIATLDFNPLGGTTPTTPTTIWLSAASGSGKRYVTLAVNPITGLVTIGPFTTTGPPLAAIPGIETTITTTTDGTNGTGGTVTPSGTATISTTGTITITPTGTTTISTTGSTSIATSGATTFSGSTNLPTSTAH